MESKELVESKKEGENFTMVNFKNFEVFEKAVFAHKRLPFETKGKGFLKEVLGATGAEISVNIIPAGQMLHFTHRHNQNEEIFICIKGSGQVNIDGTIWDIKEGSFIRIAPRAHRTWRNNGTENLVFMVVQTKEHSFEGKTISDGVGGEVPVNWD